jgi:pyruvate dehydrogenase E2 component (dihydrolipoamide acetyltransferase)
MATTVTMPKFGLTMTQGMVARWLVQEGQHVEQDQPIVVVMSAKITQEIEAPASGTVHLVVQAEETCPVGQTIAAILGPGEPPPEGVPARAAVVPTPSSVAIQALPPTPEQHRRARSSPAARRLAKELGIDISRVPGTGREGRITESDVQDFGDTRVQAQEARVQAQEARVQEQEARVREQEARVQEQEARVRIPATPLARRMAREEGLDLAQVAGTGPDGRITEDDVLHTLEGQKGPPPSHLQTLPLTGMRQVIAERMLDSLRSSAQLTLVAKADVSGLVRLRDVLRQRWDTPISYTDLLVKATASALREHPRLNSTLQDQRIVLLDEISIGVAVALDDGLIVPVVRRADQKSVLQIHHALQDLAGRARAGTLSIDEVTGSTFTLTNLGMYGIESFTPIINPPEAAILGVGRIGEELALDRGQVVARSVMPLSLTIDHRIVDGAPGASFVRTLVQFLEHPALIFATGED